MGLFSSSCCLASGRERLSLTLHPMPGGLNLEQEPSNSLQTHFGNWLGKRASQLVFLELQVPVKVSVTTLWRAGAGAGRGRFQS